MQAKEQYQARKYKDSQIFLQVQGFVDWDLFNKAVNEHNGEKGAKGITCKSQFVTMLFAALAGGDSLNDAVEGISTVKGHLNHMGIDRIPSRSNLAYANNNRPWEIYRDFFEGFAARVARRLSHRRKPAGLKRKIFSVDSTTIPLCLSLFDWARFHHAKGGVKVHSILDHDSLLPTMLSVSEAARHDHPAFREMLGERENFFGEGFVILMDRGYVSFDLFSDISSKKAVFVTRVKDNMCYEIVRERKFNAVDGVSADQEVKFTNRKAEACGNLRVVAAKVIERGKERVCRFLTNDMNLAASTVVKLYKARWQIELFFKQLKQNLKIKSFMGTTENAVKTQIYITMTAILLLRLLKDISDSRRKEGNMKTFGFSVFTQLLRISLLRSFPLERWLCDPMAPPAEIQRNTGQLELFADYLVQPKTG